MSDSGGFILAIILLAAWICFLLSRRKRGRSQLLNHPHRTAPRHVVVPQAPHEGIPEQHYWRWLKEQAARRQLLDAGALNTLTGQHDYGKIGNAAGRLADLLDGKDAPLPEDGRVIVDKSLVDRLIDAEGNPIEKPRTVIYNATDHPLFRKAKR